MFLPVELLIDLRIFYPKVGTQINHSDTGLQQGSGLFSRDSVRQCEEGDIDPAFQASHLWCFELELAPRAVRAGPSGSFERELPQPAATSEPRKNVGSRSPSRLSRGQRHYLD